MSKYYLDLFAGIGGFALGAYWAGMRFDRHYFSEVDPYAISVYRKRFPEAVFLGDVKSIGGESNLPKGDWFLSGGFPCQDISIAGKGAGLDGRRSGLWFEYARLIGEIRPKYAIIENVGALVVRGFKQILESLAEIGYDAVWQDIRASDVGAPHRRERIWIIAYPSDRNPYGKHEQTNPGFRRGKGPDAGGIRLDVAYSDSFRLEHPCEKQDEAGKQNIQAQSERSGSALAYANGERLPGRVEKQNDTGDLPRTAEERREDVSDPGREGVYESEKSGNAERKSVQSGRILRNGLPGGRQKEKGIVADSQNGGIVRRYGELGAIETELREHRRSPEDGCGEWWAAEPAVCELVDGLPAGVDGYKGRICFKSFQRANQLKCLGNAIVPQIAMLIWQQIKAVEDTNEDHF